MADCGAKNHENIGGDFLENAGFSSAVVAICRGHVNAKRYLCWKNPEYHAQLSEASKTTLTFQGGQMEEDEALKFEKNVNF